MYLQYFEIIILFYSESFVGEHTLNTLIKFVDSHERKFHNQYWNKFNG